MIVVWLFLTVPRVCLQFVIVAFPDHTYLLFWYQENAFKLPVAYADVRSKAMVLLLLIYCLLLLPFFMEVLSLFLVPLFSTLCPVLLSS